MEVVSAIEKNKIIIADDSMFIIQQLSQIFMSKGYIIAGTATNGDEAIQCYKQFHPYVKLITLDITMPVMDGITALKRILEFDQQAAAIMISALGTESLVKHALVLGAKGYILKPLNRNKVLERITRVVGAG